MTAALGQFSVSALVIIIAGIFHAGTGRAAGGLRHRAAGCKKKSHQECRNLGSPNHCYLLVDAQDCAEQIKPLSQL